ncbi:MAG: putative transcriptional regulatory protein LysR family [Microvirga sp.]|nr:putative transcriptional regulatory protein LysR family [Microvirga sp.]
MKNARLPPLVALRAFDAVGRRQSIRAAGDELAVSHTVVSRHLRNLEDWLGVKLVEARGRGLVLTAEGARYHAQIGRALEAIARATADLRPTARRTLAIWCFPGLANRRLLAHLPGLEARLPDWEIVLHPTLARCDLARGEADAEIVYLDNVENTDRLRAELLARPRVFPVASPTFMARYAGVETIRDLLRLPLIHEDSTDQWDRWLSLAGVDTPPTLSGPRLWHAHLAIEAARLGQGVALANEMLVEEDLRTGALIEVVPSDLRLCGYYLVAAASRWEEPTMVVLRDWLRGLAPQALTPREIGA